MSAQSYVLCIYIQKYWKKNMGKGWEKLESDYWMQDKESPRSRKCAKKVVASQNLGPSFLTVQPSGRSNAGDYC